MKRRIFFIVTIVIGTISFQGIFFAKERTCSIQQQRKITESLLQDQGVISYVDEMVEFPAEASQKSFVKTFLLAVLQIASKRKETVTHYFAIIKTLYYYIMGSLLNISDRLLGFFRRKQ